MQWNKSFASQSSPARNLKLEFMKILISSTCSVWNRIIPSPNCCAAFQSVLPLQVAVFDFPSQFCLRSLLSIFHLHLHLTTLSNNILRLLLLLNTEQSHVFAAPSNRVKAEDEKITKKGYICTKIIVMLSKIGHANSLQRFLSPWWIHTTIEKRDLNGRLSQVYHQSSCFCSQKTNGNNSVSKFLPILPNLM